jgi:hypothetical protein
MDGGLDGGGLDCWGDEATGATGWLVGAGLGVITGVAAGELVTVGAAAATATGARELERLWTRR